MINDDATYSDIPIVVQRSRAVPRNILLRIVLVITTMLPTAFILSLLYIMSLTPMDFIFIILLISFLSVLCAILGMIVRELRREDYYDRL